MTVALKGLARRFVQFLRDIEPETWRSIIFPVLLALVVTAIRTFGSSQDPSVDNYIVLTFLFFLFFYLGVVYQFILLKRLLLGPEVITGKDLVESALINAAKSAREFIMATGGRSRIEEYLDAITHAVQNDIVSFYYRLILGDHIHHPLHKHLKEVWGQRGVHIAHNEHEHYGQILVTEKEAIVTMPSSAAKAFDRVLRIRTPTTVQRHKDYVHDLFMMPENKRITSLDQIAALCQECTSRAQASGSAEAK